MTSIQPILPIHDHVITDVIDIRPISSIRLNVDILECPVETRVGFTAVDLDDSLAIGITGKVFKVDIGPFERSGIWVEASLGSGIGETTGQSCLSK
jgi:hypothetical protein